MLKYLAGFAVTILIVALLSYWLLGPKKVKVAPIPVPTAQELAFKPDLPPVDEKMVIAACDRVIFGVISNPTRAAKLVSGKYARTISKSTNEQVLKGRLPADQKTGLVHAHQGIIMIETGGGILPSSTAGACGLEQMLASTARDNGLKVSTDMARTNRLLKKARAGDMKAYAELARIDERFNPYKCIRGGSYFLTTLFNHYGRWDFAIAAYHGGQGNVDKLIAVYISGNFDDLGSPKKNIEAYGLTYAKIFFDCSPTRNPGTYEFLRVYKSAKKDFSGWYYWNTTAAQKAVVLYQKNRPQFLQKVWNWKNLTATRRRELMPEIVWYPRGVKTFADADKLGRAYETGELVKAPDNPEVFGFRLDTDNIGVHADESVRDRFYGTRPETMGLVMTLAYLTRQESGQWDECLTVTSLVRSRAYQAKLGSTSHSVHTVGRAVDFSRQQYESGSQRAGFQYALDYLRACGDICYAKEGDYAIHVALSPAAVVKFRNIYVSGLKHSASIK